jgi:hypothetical protein
MHCLQQILHAADSDTSGAARGLQEKDELILVRATDLREEEMQPLPAPVDVENGAGAAPNLAPALHFTTCLCPVRLIILHARGVLSGLSCCMRRMTCQADHPACKEWGPQRMPLAETSACAKTGSWDPAAYASRDGGSMASGAWDDWSELGVDAQQLQAGAGLGGGRLRAQARMAFPPPETCLLDRQQADLPQQADEPACHDPRLA